MNQRLQQFLAAENLTQAQFAESIGVAKASVSHIISGRNKPGFDFIESMARHYPSLNIEWLVTGKGKMYKKESLLFDIPDAETPQNNSGDLFQNGTEDMPYDIDTDMDTVEESVAVPSEGQVIETANTTSGTPQMQERSQRGRTRKADTPPAHVQPHIMPSAASRNIARIIVLFDDGTYQEMQ